MLVCGPFRDAFEKKRRSHQKQCLRRAAAPVPLRYKQVGDVLEMHPKNRLCFGYVERQPRATHVWRRSLMFSRSPRSENVLHVGKHQHGLRLAPGHRLSCLHGHTAHTQRYPCRLSLRYRPPDKQTVQMWGPENIASNVVGRLFQAIPFAECSS